MRLENPVVDADAQSETVGVDHELASRRHLVPQGKPRSSAALRPWRRRYPALIQQDPLFFLPAAFKAGIETSAR